MNPKLKAILIDQIINKINEQIIKENKELCYNNLHSQQKPLHGSDMWITLVFKNDEEIKEIAKACGI
jgi:hypothetical protein